jgi:hypothetical protein
VVPGFDVFIDGDNIGRSPLSTSRSVEPGSHTAVAIAADGRRAERTVRLERGAQELVTLQPPVTGGESRADLLATDASPPLVPTWTPWVAGGVMVVAAGTGAYFGARTLDRGVSMDVAESSATYANVSFAVAGVGAAATALLYYLSR